MRFRRWDDKGDFAVCAINFGARSRTVELQFPNDGRWRDMVDNRIRTVIHGRLRVRLGAYDAALFVPE